MKVITWNNTKTYNQNYAFRVHTIDYQSENQTLKEGCYPTRARATRAAKKWTRYFKAQQKVEANAALDDFNYVGSRHHY